MLDRIKELCKKRGISVSVLENKLGLPNNTIYQWKARTPGTDRLKLVADFFNVSTDYLLGRTDEPDPVFSNVPEWATAKDKRDFKKMLEEDTELMFDGVPMNDEDRQRVLDVLTGLFWDAKKTSKEKFTNKRYKKDDK